MDAAEKYVQKKDFSSLVDLILAGNSEFLEHVQSNDEEMKKFLQFVPNVNVKIEKIENAVETGSLSLLQKHLTREKFAFIVDKSSQSSLLHKSVSFGHEDITKYLANRFPELLSKVDLKGRTPLHLAGIRKDKILYEHLSRRGSDHFASDHFRKTPSQYLHENLMENGKNKSKDKWTSVLGEIQYKRFEKGLSFALNQVGREQPKNPVSRLSQLLIIYELFN